jgi:hypothetical protein
MVQVCKSGRPKAEVYAEWSKEKTLLMSLTHPNIIQVTLHLSFYIILYLSLYISHTLCADCV